MYKIVLGMSYYIHSGGPGALGDGLRPFFKESTEGAANVLPEPIDRSQRHPRLTPPPPTSPYISSAHLQWLGMLGSVCRCGTAEIIPKKFNKYYMNPTV